MEVPGFDRRLVPRFLREVRLQFLAHKLATVARVDLVAREDEEALVDDAAALLADALVVDCALVLLAVASEELAVVEETLTLLLASALEFAVDEALLDAFGMSNTTAMMSAAMTITAAATMMTIVDVCMPFLGGCGCAGR